MFHLTSYIHAVIDIVLFEVYLNAYFFHVHKILIEHWEDDLQVYFLHVQYHYIQYFAVE